MFSWQLIITFTLGKKGKQKKGLHKKDKSTPKLKNAHRETAHSNKTLTPAYTKSFQKEVVTSKTPFFVIDFVLCRFDFGMKPLRKSVFSC